ncbi:heterokaryon incompatibility protein-domain-containing protein [Hypoxylon rubiginosum]|uniref:Heterokaryon incompatibility protein-domain-containing protein n=1 Tax=Hypoxylon rubiginosum TaxID=110542 RepID=A0ACB9YJ59_9PEZI|nr:heterokaryon incompatibility protein-domain-containing protein [Hypoxylon rubiginosum]
MSSTDQHLPFDYSHVSLATGPLIRILELDPYGQAGPKAPLKGCLRLRRFEPPGRTEISWHIPRFEALSYVWGDQSDPEEITLYTTSGRFWSSSKKHIGVLRIGRNLAAALRRLRHKRKKRALWCDSICINQNDLAEREREVQRMAHIYLHTDKVVAWLGPEADDSQLALEKLAFTGSQIVSKGWDDGVVTSSATPKADERYTQPDVEFPFSPREWQAIERLIDRPWFKRLWVRQEIALACSAVIVCGNAEVSWTLLKNATICLAQKLPRPKLPEDCLTRYEKNLENLNSLIFANAGMSNSDVIALTRDSLCMDDRDRVYGVLGILAKYSDGSLVSANYSLSIKEVYRDFAICYSRQYGDLSLLEFCETATEPSWVPDLQNLKDSPYPLISHSSCSAVGTLEVLGDDKVLVSGIHCGTIQTSFSSVPLSCSINTIRESIAAMLPEILGSKACQTEDGTYEKFIRAILPDELDNVASMTELKALFNSWQNGVADGEQKISSIEGEILRRLNRNIRGRSCHLTIDGSIILGPSTAEKGDQIYVIPGCDVPLVLRRGDATAYRIIGSCYHPEYANREALLGKLPRAWRVLSDEGSLRYINDEQKAETLHDPRLGPLPPGWKETKLSTGGLGWYSDQYDHNDLIDFDPRLAIDALQARGILIQQIALV